MFSEQLWWHVSRATGMVSWAILTLSILWGLALSTKLLGKRTPPAWLLNLHRFLGGFGVLLVGLHMISLVPDNYVHFGWSELFVPFASPWQTGAITWGIVAFYLLIAVEVTSLAMKRLPRKFWRYVHFSSFVLWVVATVHAITAGTDAEPSGVPVERHRRCPAGAVLHHRPYPHRPPPEAGAEARRHDLPADPGARPGPRA